MSDTRRRTTPPWRPPGAASTCTPRSTPPRRSRPTATCSQCRTGPGSRTAGRRGPCGRQRPRRTSRRGTACAARARQQQPQRLSCQRLRSTTTVTFRQGVIGAARLLLAVAAAAAMVCVCVFVWWWWVPKTSALGSSADVDARWPQCLPGAGAECTRAGAASRAPPPSSHSPARGALEVEVGPGAARRRGDGCGKV